MGIEVICTPRLSLRSVTLQDAEPLHLSVLSDADVMRLVFRGGEFTPARSRVFIECEMDHEGTGTRPGVLVERATESIIGFAGLMPCDVLGEADYELGFVLARHAWGKGFATEIGRGQLEFGFAKLRCRRLLAQAGPTNSGSISALEKLGMRRHSTVETRDRGPRHIYVAEKE